MNKIIKNLISYKKFLFFLMIPVIFFSGYLIKDEIGRSENTIILLKSDYERELEGKVSKILDSYAGRGNYKVSINIDYRAKNFPKDENLNYLNTDSISLQKFFKGYRLLISVWVNYKSSITECDIGKFGYRIWAPEELLELENIVKGITGFSDKNGDSISVNQTPFYEINILWVFQSLVYNNLKLLIFILLFCLAILLIFKIGVIKKYLKTFFLKFYNSLRECNYKKASLFCAKFTSIGFFLGAGFSICVFLSQEAIEIYDKFKYNKSFEFITDSKLLFELKADYIKADMKSDAISFHGSIKNEGPYEWNKITIQVVAFNKSGNYLYNFDYEIKKILKGNNELFYEYTMPCNDFIDLCINYNVHKIKILSAEKLKKTFKGN